MIMGICVYSTENEDLDIKVAGLSFLGLIYFVIFTQKLSILVLYFYSILFFMKGFSLILNGFTTINTHFQILSFDTIKYNQGIL